MIDPLQASLPDFLKRSEEYLQKITSSHPLRITDEGEAYMVMSEADYRSMVDEAYTRYVLAEIEAGEASAARGELLDTEEARKYLQRLFEQR